MPTLLYVILPYLVLCLAVGGGISRYFTRRFSCSSLSSQLLENRTLFWGSVPWHFGIIPILLAHLVAGLVPGWRGVLGGPTRLVVFELGGMALALFTVFGIVVLVARRLRRGSAARAVTSRMDWLLLVILLVQVALGLVIAATQRWGARWYVETAGPWFRSLWRLSPEYAAMVPLPSLVQVHLVLGLVLIGLFPFTRLSHIFTVPLTYLWRPYQLVIWGRAHGRGGTVIPAGGEEPPSSAGVATAGPPGETPARRHFLSALSVGLGALAAAIVAVPSIGFLLGLRRTPTVWQKAGPVDRFAVNAAVEVAFSDPSSEPWAGVTARTAAWLRRTGPRSFVAFSNNCTHLGCPVRWLPDAELFMCPCHGGVFYQDGRVAAGPTSPTSATGSHGRRWRRASSSGPRTCRPTSGR